MALAIGTAACSSSSDSSSPEDSAPDGKRFVVKVQSEAPADDEQLEATEAILRRRLDAIGVRDAEITRSGDQLVVRVTGDSAEAIKTDWESRILRNFELRFREVLGEIPYSATSAVTVAGAVDETCRDGAAVTKNAADPEFRAQQVVLSDLQKQSCLALGATLLTGAGIDFAEALVNPNTAAWEVLVRFTNDDFITKVAEPLVGKRVAIELDGIVLTSPHVNPGITGREVQITGDFTETEANELARTIPDPLPTPLKIVSIEPARS